MISRYFELLPFIDADDEELADVLPPPASKRRLRVLYDELKDVESVSKALQGSKVDLLDVRTWFDGLIGEKSTCARYFAPKADIAHSPDFESGCVRVLNGQSNRLTRAEKVALEGFLVSPPREDNQGEDEQEPGESFVERMQKRRRLEKRKRTYQLLASIPPTSNVVERFFSIARTKFGQQRHSLHQYTLEMLLFLRQNADYWDARTVESAE